MNPKKELLWSLWVHNPTESEAETFSERAQGSPGLSARQQAHSVFQNFSGASTWGIMGLGQLVEVPYLSYSCLVFNHTY